MSDPNPRGRFVWYELLTSDPDAAIAFYTGLLGWDTQAWAGADPPYTMWTNAGTPLGGVMTLPPEAKAQGAPPHWLAYVSTPDVDALATQATGLGAKVLVPPRDIPTVGRFSVVADPQGAVFALFKSASQTPGREGPPQRGEISWHELATTDHVAAFDFYQQLFGWEKGDAMDMGPAGTYQMYSRGGQVLGGMFNKPPDMPAPPHWLLYVSIDDVHAGVETVKTLGGQVLNGPMEVPGGDLVAQCLDPQGVAFAIHSKAVQA